MSLYNNVKNACREKGISIRALEEKLGFPRSSICKWDANVPSVDKVKAVSDELCKPMEYFFQTDDAEHSVAQREVVYMTGNNDKRRDDRMSNKLIKKVSFDFINSMGIGSVHIETECKSIEDFQETLEFAEKASTIMPPLNTKDNTP